MNFEQCAFAVACVVVSYGVGFWRGLRQGHEIGFTEGKDWSPHNPEIKR